MRSKCYENIITIILYYCCRSVRSRVSNNFNVMRVTMLEEDVEPEKKYLIYTCVYTAYGRKQTGLREHLLCRSPNIMRVVACRCVRI